MQLELVARDREPLLVRTKSIDGANEPATQVFTFGTSDMLG